MYCSEVVGMLREKDPMIAQLRDVALQTKRARSKALKARRVEEQEDLIYRVREVGWSGGEGLSCRGCSVTTDVRFLNVV